MGTTLEPVGTSNADDLLSGERLLPPVTIAQGVERIGGLLVGTRLEHRSSVAMTSGFVLRMTAIGTGRWTVSDVVWPPRKRTWIAMRSASSRRNVLDEQGDHALALERRACAVVPDAREIGGEGKDASAASALRSPWSALRCRSCSCCRESRVRNRAFQSASSESATRRLSGSTFKYRRRASSAS